MAAQISPMKKGKKAFFDTKITDGCKNMRVVGFQPGHHKKLTTFKEKMESMAITEEDKVSQYLTMIKGVYFFIS